MICTNLYLRKVNSSCFCFIFSQEYTQENTEENEEFQEEKCQISQDENKELVRYFIIIFKIIQFKEIN